MRSNSTRLPAGDIHALMRCRSLVEERDRLQENICLAAAVSLQGVLSADGMHSHTSRLQQQKERVKALEQEIAPARVMAQQAADRIPNICFRRFCELYCIDGAGLYAAGTLSGCSERTINRYASLLNSPTECTGGQLGE